MDTMAVAIHIKYALSLNRHLTSYFWISAKNVFNPSEFKKKLAEGLTVTETEDREAILNDVSLTVS